VSSLYLQHPAFTRWRTGRFGARGLSSSYWQGVLQIDPQLYGLAVCVELVFGDDHVVRVANRQCSTRSSLTGEVQSWHGLLSDSISITMDYQLASGSSTAKTLSVTVPNALVNAAGLIAAGRLLSGVAEVSLNVDGGDHDQRIVLIRGDMDDVQFGAIAQVVSCTVTDPLASCDQQLPPYVLTSERISGLPSASEGQRLPVVLPSFDPLPAILVSSSVSTPAYAVCHGHLTITAVYVDGAAYTSTSIYYPWAQVNAVDAMGEPYTRLSFTGGLSGFSGDEAVYVSVSGGPSDGTPTTIIRELVEGYTTLGPAGASHGLFAEAQAKLGSRMAARCAVNASGASNTTVIAFIEGEFLTSFPMVSMIWEGGGYGPIVTDRRAPPVLSLVADQWPLLDRATSVSESPRSNLQNTFTMQYGYDPLTDAYTGVVQRDPTNSLLCQISRQMVGERQGDVVESLWIAEQQVAEAVVDWLVEHTALPSYRVDYLAAPWVLLHLRRGDTVLLTDAEFGWSEQRATVESITYTPSACTLGLRVWARYYALGGGSASASMAGGA
jgi:hypothetical protein